MRFQRVMNFETGLKLLVSIGKVGYEAGRDSLKVGHFNHPSREFPRRQGWGSIAIGLGNAWLPIATRGRPIEGGELRSQELAT